MSQEQPLRPQESLDGDVSSLQRDLMQIPESATSSAAVDLGLSLAVAEIDSPRKRMVTESIAEQVLFSFLFF